MGNELFDSAVRSNGDLAGVFEYDGATGYFYLCDVSEKEQQRVVDSIRVLLGETDLAEEDITVRWDEEERRVGLFLRGTQWAVFNAVTGAKYGGDFHSNPKPNIPPEEKFL